jgi:capsule polysaccharide export protein KpsE/RkpR
MEMQTVQEPTADPYGVAGEERRDRAQRTLWQVAGTLFRWRKFIGAVTGVVAVLAVVISLLLPDWYRASTRLLLPEDSGGGLTSVLLGDLSSAAQSLLGGGGDYVRYLAILSSRTTMKSVIERFDLTRVYEVEDNKTPLKDAMELLAENADFVIDDEYEFLSIEVLDKDPQRAADMANFFVHELNRINGDLSALTAGNLRGYVERRYGEAQRVRSNLLDSLRAFQQRYGVFDLEAQTEAYFSQLAELRVYAIQLEIQHEALRERVGPNNAQVLSLQDMVEAANRKYRAALAGREQVLPIPQASVPDAVRQFADFTLERTIQERILELVAPMLEQARFEEQREREAVQVLDVAVPPVEKAKPYRAVICIFATLSAFILAILFVLAYDWWERNYAVIAQRLSETVAEGSPARDH